MREVIKANLIATGMLFAFVLFIVYGYGILMNRIMWALIITPVWIMCHGGWVYIKMMGANSYGHHEENGKVIIDEWFMRTAHGQYRYEGYIFSAMTVLLGILFIFVFKVNKFISQ